MKRIKFNFLIFELKKNLFHFLSFCIICLFFLFQYSNIFDIRYATDDICRITLIDKMGFGYVREEYLKWDGRFSFKIIFAISYILFKNYSPVIVSFLLILVFFLFIYKFLARKINIKFFDYLLLFIFFKLFLLDIQWYRQLFFNKTLSLTYILPSVFIIYLIYLLSQSQFVNKKLIFFNSFILILLSGFHEIFSVSLIIIFFIYSLLDIFFKRKSKNILFLLTSIFGFLIMFLAPGNRVRSSYFFNSLDYFSVINGTLLNFFSLANNLLSYKNFLFENFYFVLMLGFYLGLQTYIFSLNYIKFFILNLFFLGIIFIFTSNFLFFKIIGTGIALGSRHSFFIEFTFFVLYFFVWFFIGFLLSYVFKKIKSKSALLKDELIYKSFSFLGRIFFIIFTVFFISKNFIQTRPFFNQLKFYADHFDKYVVKNKVNNLNKDTPKVFLPNFPIDLEQFNQDKNSWTFKCLQDYIGKKIILEKIN